MISIKAFLISLIMLSALANCLTALEYGSTYDEVIQELGKPDGILSGGSKQLLTYGTAKVTLKSGRVVSYSAELAQTRVEQDRHPATAEAVQTNPKPSQNHGTWLTDFAQAQKIAAAENKKLLLNFTGSDWCGWCIRLDQEVFAKEAFLKAAHKDYVLVKLDFPRGKKLPANLKRQNEALARQYGIRGFPSIIVLKPNGKLHSQGGYVRGGPKAFLKSIR